MTDSFHRQDRAVGNTRQDVLGVGSDSPERAQNKVDALGGIDDLRRAHVSKLALDLDALGCRDLDGPCLFLDGERDVAGFPEGSV